MARTQAVARLVGGIQCGLGVIASIFSFLIYASPSMRDALAIASNEVNLFMFFFLVFSVFSISSGLLLASQRS